MTTKSEKKQRTSDYEEFLRAELDDVETAAEYLTAAFHEGEDVFLLAVREVVEARGGIAQLAKATSLNREGLYDMLSAKGNPRLSSLSTVLDSLGITMTFAPKTGGAGAA
jgi:probable addiction module antidote protein